MSQTTLLVLADTFERIADAIRTMKGTQAQICPIDMPNEILTIPAGGTDYIALMMDGMSSGCTTFDYDNDSTTTFPASSSSPFCKNTYAVENIRFRELLSVPTYLFQYLKGLLTLTLDKANNIGDSSVDSCQALTTVDLKAQNGGTIYNSFGRCTVLDAVILRSPVVWTLASGNAFRYTAIKDGNGYFYVPRALITTYEIASYWSNFAGQFRALEDYTDDGTTSGTFIHP